MGIHMKVIRFIKDKIKYFLKTYSHLRGDIFANAGPIDDNDSISLKKSINQIKPRIFIEVGTGRGASTREIYKYLHANCPNCHFYTIDILKKFTEAVDKEFPYETFHTYVGLSVLKEEVTSPASEEVKDYSGPANILRKIIKDLNDKKVDMAFIDSRKGSALSEFKILEKHLSSKGIIFCHDAYVGKGVEVVEYLRRNRNKFGYEIIPTKAGLLKVWKK